MPGKGPFSPDTTGSVRRHEDTQSAAHDFNTPPQDNERERKRAAKKSTRDGAPLGHGLFERGTDRIIAKQYWAERERYKDVMRREQWDECTFHPQLSARAARLARPRSLSPQFRFRAEALRKMEKIQTARRALVEAELEPCTFQPLTLRAASLSPYAPVRDGDVHEALYRVAEVKRKWAQEMRPEVLAQLTQRVANADPDRKPVPQMSQREIEGIVWRLLHPAEYERHLEAEAVAEGRQRSRSRSPPEADPHLQIDPRPRINPTSAELAEAVRQRRDLPADVVERLTLEVDGVHRDGELKQIRSLSATSRGAAVTEEDPSVKQYLDGGSHRPTLNPASEQIAATSRERHCRQLFFDLWHMAEALKAEHAHQHSGAPQDNADATSVAPGRPPLAGGRSPQANEVMTVVDFIAALPCVLPEPDCRDVEEVLRWARRDRYDASSFHEACVRFARRVGSRPFMVPVAPRSSSAQQQTAPTRITVARAVPRTDKYAAAERGDRGRPDHRRTKHTERTLNTMKQIKEFADYQELRECTFKPKLNNSGFVFVRRGSSMGPQSSNASHDGVSVGQLRDALESNKSSAGGHHHHHHHGHGLPRSLNAPSREAQVEAEAVSQLTARTQAGSPRARISRPRSADPVRIPAKTVMTAAHVYPGSFSEEHAVGGDDRLRQLGRELMQQQLLSLGATKALPAAGHPL